MKKAIISVSYAKGCYRHIAIPLSATFYTLAKAILWAFSFDNDHAHVFFMDNKLSWTRPECSIYCPEIDEDEDDFEDTMSMSSTEQVCLCNVDSILGASYAIEKGRKFKFLFDFGDEHIFQCNVLRIVGKEDTYVTLDEAEIDRMFENIGYHSGADDDMYDDFDDEADKLDGDTEAVIDGLTVDILRRIGDSPEQYPMYD